MKSTRLDLSSYILHVNKLSTAKAEYFSREKFSVYPRKIIYCFYKLYLKKKTNFTKAFSSC